jgi:hypothetical protein
MSLMLHAFAHLAGPGANRRTVGKGAQCDAHVATSEQRLCPPYRLGLTVPPGILAIADEVIE